VPNDPALVFLFDVIRLTGYGAIAEKTLSVVYAELFCAPCKKNYALDRKKYIFASTAGWMNKQDLSVFVLVVILIFLSEFQT